MTNDARETINEEITQSYKSKPVSNSRQKEINSGKTMESKTKINLMKTIAVNSNKEQNNNTLIEKYFKDQMDRNKCKQHAAKSQIDRKVYLRLYKQKHIDTLVDDENLENRTLTQEVGD